MNIFAKTGIRQLRKNKQSSLEPIQDVQRRLEKLPRHSKNTHYIGGQQIKAGYILYGEEGDNYQINDEIWFETNQINKETDYSGTGNITKLVVKEDPNIYSVENNGYNQELFLESKN